MRERARLATPDWPRAAFVERRFDGDPTNWWVPDAAAAQAMLRASGFRIERRLAHETWLCTPDAAQDASERARIDDDLETLFGIDEAAA